MNNDKLEGTARSAIGQGEQIIGGVLRDKSTIAQGRYDEGVGKAQSAFGNVKAAISDGVDAASSMDLPGVRDGVAKAAQSVGEAVQKQASTARDQVVSAMGAAGDNLSQSASDAQDRLISMEEDIGARIQKNPWTAVAIAAFVGLVIGKMT